MTRLATFQLRPPRLHPESDLQRALIRFWSLQYPVTWALTMHCPSGVAIDPKRAAIFRGLGWKRGIPDLLCFARLGEYAGLALELKADPKGKPSEDQNLWLRGLAGEGWKCAVVADLDSAIDVLHVYHGKEP